MFDSTWNLKSCLTEDVLTEAQKRAIGGILGPGFMPREGGAESRAPADHVATAVVTTATDREPNPFQANASGTDWAVPAVVPSETGAALSNPGEKAVGMPGAISTGAVLKRARRAGVGNIGKKDERQLIGGHYSDDLADVRYGCSISVGAASAG